MFCVIQELNQKKVECLGKPKRIESIEYSIDGKTMYSYMNGDRFERPIKKAYKISVHSSYRENGKIKKKQWYICTMQHYSLIDYGGWIGDCVREGKIKTIANEIGITEDDLYEMIYKKLDPLIDKIKAEYEKTEEYKIDKENNEILKKFIEEQSKFDNVYGHDTYRQCYDVFGNLKNKNRLEELKEQKKDREEYERKSRSYYNNNYGNYNYNEYSSYFKPIQSNYNENEKRLLKEAFKSLAMKYHPDRGGDTETMAEINNLKEKIMKG